MIQLKNFINGEFLNPIQNQWLDNYNPSNGSIYGQLPNSCLKDVNFAYEAAKKAFESWSNTPIEKRSAILLKIASLIDDNLDRFAEAESKDNGKPISVAKRLDVPRAASNFRFFGHAITQFQSESHETKSEKTINYTLRHPLGVVGCISPWNLPLYLLTWKIAPALAAGNCVIAKPSEITPYTAFLLGEICNKAGLPKGVLNIIHGKGANAGQAIIEHVHIKAISFTGGTETGKIIARTAAPMFKKLSLELGGKNPNIIFADCDYEKMLMSTVKSSFSNQGQICLCGSRIFVEASIFDRFKTDFIKCVSKLIVGPPSNKSTQIGALVSKAHYEKVLSFIDRVGSDGSKLLYGGKRVHVKDHEGGYYLTPTIVQVESNSCQLNQEEIFGPVVTIMPFESESQVLEMANDVKYGLSATVWTNNLKRSLFFSEHLECGIVWVNTWMQRDLRTPFGGVKSSGLGREGGFEVLRFFSETKNICINYK